MVGKGSWNDYSFGPMDQLEEWFYITYLKTQGTLSINVLKFPPGYDKSPNKERVEQVNIMMTDYMGFGPEYFEQGDYLIIIMPLGVTESAFKAFKNELMAKL